MKVRFLGAIGTVTGSCSWLRDEARGWNFLVDCGLHQDEPGAALQGPGDWPFEPATIQFVALTHAHLDHCGLVPALVRAGFRGEVRCTRETAEIARIVLENAARFVGSGIRQQDVARIRWKPFRADVAFGQPRPVAQDLFLRTYRSGHIPGAASIEVLWGAPGPEQRGIVFSGDLGPGREDAEVAPMLRYPWNPRRANFAVLESTYGGTVRAAEDRDADLRLARLRELLDGIVQRGGTLLLPAFAVGRAQDLMHDLHAVVAADPVRFEALRIHLDAPLARLVQSVVAKAMARVDQTATKIRPLWLGKQVFRQLGLDDSEPGDIDAALAIVAMTLTGVRGQATPAIARGNALARAWRPLTEAPSATLDRGRAPDGPTVIVCGSADGQGGTAASWLPTLLPDARHVVATTGYTPGSSVMGRLATLAELPRAERRRHTGALEWESGKSMPIRAIGAEVTRLRGYSAHADQAELLDWVFLRREDGAGQVAPKVFLQHGEDGARRSLRDAIGRRARESSCRVDVVLPGRDDGWFELDDEPLRGRERADPEPACA